MTSSEKQRFIAILQEHKGILLKVIRSYCKNPEDWQDLEQEIVIQLWKALKQYDDRYKLSTYIYRIALNVAISHHRKERKRRDVEPLNDALFHLAEDQSHAELEERTRILYQGISNLNELERALVMLYLDDYSHAEISDILGITESNVSTKLNRIKAKLKTSLTTINTF